MHRIPLLLLTTALAGPAAAQAGRPGWTALQAVVVTTAGWDATSARVQRWERAAAADAWRPVGGPMDAMVGLAGLGWGTGLHPLMADGPRKREGDGRAPAGVYRLSSAFGYASGDQIPWIRLPYRQSTAFSRCVDDPASRWYNRWADADRVNVDWSSHEEMRRPDELYRLGVWVDHNADPPSAGAGSCIFLHIWRGPGVPTVGCTSFAAAELETLLRWLDPARSPVLVQLPESEYARLRTEWSLP
jgi:L,D-peptidoglycan transpeptidase YkuD (ErfK/YbiS/YcfS/YnhG family)